MTEQVRREGFLAKEVYIGVCLGTRKGRDSLAASKGGVLSQFKKSQEVLDAALDNEEEVISAEEIAHWTTRAAVVERNLAGSYLKAVPAGAAAVARLVRSPLHPEIDVPVGASDSRPWGPGDIHALAEGHITNGHRMLKIEQPGPDGRPQTGYTATFSLSRFPDVISFPYQEAWIHFASSLAFPVEISSRFQVVPSNKVQKDVNKALQAANDMAAHTAEAGVALSLQLQETLDTAVALEFTIGKDRMPFIYGRHRLTVTASDPDELAARFLALRNHYRDLQIDVVWSSGDQLELLCESQPGDKVRGSSYYQRQELSLLAGGMPTAAADVGDRVDEYVRGWQGAYIGGTTSRVRNPVFFSPHVAPARNAPPGVAICGAPGGGKSFLGFLLTYQATMQGVQVVLIDPKADAQDTARLPGLGRTTVLDLAHGEPGILDPFALGDDPSQSKLLAIETLRLLLGGKALAADREQALFEAVETVASRSRPSLAAVVEELLRDKENKHAYNLGIVLRTISSMPFARLCFDSGTEAPVRTEGSLTIITLLGLDLPAPELAPEDYGYENRLAVASMYLVTRHARRLMLNVADKNAPKLIAIDEAWAVTGTPQGAKLIPEVAKMGRSHNTGLIVISQDAQEVMAVKNSLSTVFAFGSKNDQEISSVLQLLGMEDNPDNRATVRELRNGECLMRDVDGRVARVQIDAGDPKLFKAFDTNPETRGQGSA